MDTKEVIEIFANEAERLGADANDDAGIVRSLVNAHGLGFCCWLCVCCELADRSARREGFDNQSHRAFVRAKERIAARQAGAVS